LGFFLAWLLSLFKTSLFFIVNVIDNYNDVFDTADSNNGDDNDKKSVNNQEDTVDAVNRDDSNTVDVSTLDVVHFFSTFKTDLPFFFFVGVSNIFMLMLFMVLPMNECWGQLHVGSGGGDCILAAARVFFTSMRWRPNYK
jgi:hypothetical protein